MAILIKDIAENREMSDSLAAFLANNGGWAGLLEEVAFYSDLRELLHPAFAQKPPPPNAKKQMNELLASFGLRFGMQNHLLGSDRRRVMELYAKKDLLPSWESLKMNSPVRGLMALRAWAITNDGDYVRTFVSGPHHLKLEILFEPGIDSWVWLIGERGGTRLYQSISAHSGQPFDDELRAYEDLKETYEKIQRYSEKEKKGSRKMAKHVAPESQGPPKRAGKPKSRRPTWQESIGPSKRQRRSAQIKVSEKDILVQAAEFGDVPGIPAYSPTISRLVRQGQLKESTVEPGAYVITAAGRKMLPEGNPGTKFKVHVTGTYFSVETGEMKMNQTVMVEALTKDEARKKAASKVSNRALDMGYEFDGSHRGFKTERVNPGKKKAKKNVADVIPIGRAVGFKHYGEKALPIEEETILIVAPKPGRSKGTEVYSVKVSKIREKGIDPTPRNIIRYMSDKHPSLVGTFEAYWDTREPPAAIGVRHKDGRLTFKNPGKKNARRITSHAQRHGGPYGLHHKMDMISYSLGTIAVGLKGEDDPKALAVLKRGGLVRGRSPNLEITRKGIDALHRTYPDAVTFFNQQWEDGRVPRPVPNPPKKAKKKATSRRRVDNVGEIVIVSEGDVSETAEMIGPNEWRGDGFIDFPGNPVEYSVKGRSYEEVHRKLRKKEKELSKAEAARCEEPEIPKTPSLAPRIRKRVQKGNPKKKAKKKTASPAKALVTKCQKAWGHYCERPGRKRLKEVFAHLEKMEKSTAKTVRDELRRCKRSAKAEAKRLGIKV